MEAGERATWKGSNAGCDPWFILITHYGPGPVTGAEDSEARVITLQAFIDKEVRQAGRALTVPCTLRL